MLPQRSCPSLCCDANGCPRRAICAAVAPGGRSAAELCQQARPDCSVSRGPSAHHAVTRRTHGECGGAAACTLPADTVRTQSLPEVCHGRRRRRVHLTDGSCVRALGADGECFLCWGCWVCPQPTAFQRGTNSAPMRVHRPRAWGGHQRDHHPNHDLAHVRRQNRPHCPARRHVRHLCQCWQVGALSAAKLKTRKTCSSAQQYASSSILIDHY